MFEVDTNTRVCHWVLSEYCIVEDMEEMDWNNEFTAMKEYICNYFNLKDNNELKVVHFEDDTDVDDGKTCKTVWEELIASTMTTLPAVKSW